MLAIDAIKRFRNEINIERLTLGSLTFCIGISTT